MCITFQFSIKSESNLSISLIIYLKTFTPHMGSPSGVRHWGGAHSYPFTSLEQLSSHLAVI